MKKSEYERLRAPLKKARLVNKTSVRGADKDRWECPFCKEENNPESRFNLSQKKRGMLWFCRFCRRPLQIPSEEEINENQC
ncbi:MAG: hypothetical protein ACLFTR_03390 [Candidatus Woesearchaeota archaeon]